MRSLVAVLAFVLVGFVPPKLTIRPRTATATITIVHSGEMFDLINSTDCVPYPSEEAKKAGGQSGWNGWKPKDGDQGVAVAKAKHCFQERMVVFVKLGDYYVAIGEAGIRFDSGRIEDLPLLTK